MSVITTPQADFVVQDGGSVCLVTPLTSDARAWVDANVALEAWQWLGSGFGVDH